MLQPENTGVSLELTSEIASSQDDFRQGAAVLWPWVRVNQFQERKTLYPHQTEPPDPERLGNQDDESEEMAESLREGRMMDVFLYSVANPCLIDADHIHQRRMHPLALNVQVCPAGKDKREVQNCAFGFRCFMEIRSALPHDRKHSSDFRHCDSL